MRRQAKERICSVVGMRWCDALSVCEGLLRRRSDGVELDGSVHSVHATWDAMYARCSSRRRVACTSNGAVGSGTLIFTDGWDSPVG